VVTEFDRARQMLDEELAKGGKKLLELDEYVQAALMRALGRIIDLPPRFGPLALSEAVGRQLEARGMAWAELARKAGISYRTLGALKRGDEVSLETIRAVCAVLGLTLHLREPVA